MSAEILKDVRYGKAKRNFVDIAFPDNASGNIDLVLMIHGGAWTAGNKNTYFGEIQRYAEAGLVAASMNYRYISHRTSCLDIMDDITAALAKIKATGADKGINIEKVMLTGLSAGGHLSLLYGYSRCEEAPVKPAIVFTLSGPADLSDDDALDEFMFGNEMGGIGHMQRLLSKLIGARVKRKNFHSEKILKFARQASPVCFVNENTVPTVISHAVHDTIVPYCNAVNLDKALTQNGVEHKLIPYPTSRHVLEKDPECGEEATKYVNDYINKYLSVFKAE